MTAIDPKRTGVKAVLIAWTEPPIEMIGDRWHALPGSMIPFDGPNDGISHLIACPGCGQIGSAREGEKWEVVGGSLADVTTLSLSPSIAKSCCGWHGHLKNGVFESC